MSKYRISILINCDDISDLKMHLTTIREQAVQAIKANPDEPETPILLEAHGSDHEIRIEVFE